MARGEPDNQRLTLEDYEAIRDDLEAKLDGRKPFAVPTDDFRRMAVEVGLLAVKDRISELNSSNGKPRKEPRP